MFVTCLFVFLFVCLMLSTLLTWFIYYICLFTLCYPPCWPGLYGLTTLNKPKSRQVYTNVGIITQNIFNAAVSTSVELKTNTKKLYFCEYLLSTWCLLHPEYQIYLFRDNLSGIQWVKRMCVWSVKEGMNLSVIWTIVTFLHTRGPSSKSVWVATPFRSFFWKCTVQASLWYAALDRGEGKKK